MQRIFSNSDAHVWLTVVMCASLWLVWPHIQRCLQWLATFNKLPGPTFIQLIKLHWQVFITKDMMFTLKVFREMLTPFIHNSPLFRIWLGHYPCVFLCKAESVKTLLISQTQTEKAKVYKYLRNWLGDGLILSKGSKWQQRRKLLTPAFHFKILEDFQLVMNDQAAILVQLLHQKCQETKCGEFDIYPFINRCALDILCETAMGHKVNAQLDNESEHVKAIDSFEEMLVLRILNPLLYIDWMYQTSAQGRLEQRYINISRGFNNKVIKMKRQKLAESKKGGMTKVDGSVNVLGVKHRVALLDLLLQKSMEDDINNGQPLTDQDMREEVDTFMQVGHSTTSAAITCVLYYVGIHPHIQQKIVDEMAEVSRDSEGETTSSHLQKLKYLECVIKETLRLCPIAPVIGRHLTEEMNICGYTIPAGVTAVISAIGIHRDPAYFPQPLIFDPDRFLPENSRDRDPYVYLPFSAGPRNCIGQRYAIMEVKAVVAAVLKRFRLTVLEPHMMAKVINNGMSKPIRGLRVRVEPRST